MGRWNRWRGAGVGRRLAAASVALLIVGCATRVPPYSRAEWGYGAVLEGDCLNIRAKLLRERSKGPVQMRPSGCSVQSGLWDDYYYPETHTRAGDVEIDHVVPLKHAHDRGGNGWSAEQKRAFANDPENLVITNKRYNRAKGAKTPLEWVPIHRDYACKYLKDWISIKERYRLKIVPEERSAVAGCPN